MRGFGSWKTWLVNGATGLALVAAVGLLVRDRVLPSLRERGIADPGERVPAELRVVDLARGDTIALRRLGPSTLLAVLSTCPACERSAPAWRDALGRSPGRLGVLLLGNADREAEWAAREIPGAEAFLPLDREELLRRLRIRVVPTALAISPGGVLLERREGPVGPDEAAELLSAPAGRPATTAP
ncbi:MAG: hypothetical protein R6X22_11360 [Gemmatimonadota bacterium]